MSGTPEEQPKGFPPFLAPFSWEKSTALVGGSGRDAYFIKSADNMLAREFIREYWSWAYGQRSALFVNFPPKVMGELIGYGDDGLPIHRPTSPPAEIWFLPDTQFGDAWAFARVKGFAESTTPAALVEACDAFLADLALRHPIGIEAVGEGWASFRRYNVDGGAFDLPDMRRAWELNMAILGGRQDTLQMDPRVPRHFVRDGVFHFGL